jgi:hypothetical protein
MYRGQIIGQYKNMSDIADIHGDRKGGQDFLDIHCPVIQLVERTIKTLRVSDISLAGISSSRPRIAVNFEPVACKSYAES